MPYPNEHAARVIEPGDFESESFRRKELPDSGGVVVVLGKLKGGDGAMVVQSFRFPKDKFTAAQAKTWLIEHEIEPIEFEAASDGEEKSIVDQIKAGSRHNELDLKDLQAIHDTTIRLGALCPDPTRYELPKGVQPMVYNGHEVKALGDGRVGGYLVRFSGPDELDLAGDYFDDQTDYGNHKTTAVFYNHGQDPQIGTRQLGPNGQGDLKRDEFGVWCETQLNMRDQYEAFVHSMVEKGKIGWSSGTAGHLVERVPRGKGYWIKKWLLGLDASLTPAPMEFRNTVLPMKSLPIFTAAEASGQAGASDELSNPQNTKANQGDGGNAMEKSEVLALFEQWKTEQAAAAEAKAAQDQVIADAEEAGYQRALKEFSKIRAGGYAYHKLTDPGFKDDEVKSFLHWVRTGDEVPLKAAMQEGQDSEGGFYVPSSYETQIIAKRNEASLIEQLPVARFTTTKDKHNVPVEGTAAGKFVVTEEEEDYDEEEPTAGNAPITIHKLTKLVKISEELENDAIEGFGTYLAGVWGRAMAAADNYYHIASGTGSGEPLSMLAGSGLGLTTAGATAITAAEFIEFLYAYPDEYAGEAVLIMRRNCLGYLRGLLVATPYAFIPQNDPGVGSGNARAHGHIFGIPVYCTSEMPNLSAGAPVTATKHVMMVAPSVYGVSDRAGMSVSRNPYLYQRSGQIGLFAKYRRGGTVLQSEGFTHLLQA